MLNKPKTIKKIYMDHASSAPLKKEVFLEMKPFFNENYGNPSALYSLGRLASAKIKESRKNIAKLINALPENIIFTGSGTEANNLAIFGVARANAKHGKHIITSTIEHHSVSKPINQLKKEGFEITEIPVNEKGVVDVKKIIQAIRPDTILISIMFANNEMGAIQPIDQIGREILKYRKTNNTIYPFFMSDSCQAAGYIDIGVERNHLDLMVVNGSKIYGPKGIGFLYCRRGVLINPIIYGGEQEKGMRAGTENVANIAGLAKAFELAQNNKEKESKKIQSLAQYFWNQVKKTIPDVLLNGPEIGEFRLSNNLNISFKGVEGEAMLLYLDEFGIMCSTGSACTSEFLEASHVLLAMGIKPESAHGSIRFTLGFGSNKTEIDYIIKYLPGIVAQLREMSPFQN